MAKHRTADPTVPRTIDDLGVGELQIVLLEIARALAAKHGREAALHALAIVAEALADDNKPPANPHLTPSTTQIT